MKQEDKELLLKDLCARLAYGVKILHKGWNFEWDQELSTLEKITGIDERFIYTKVIDDNGEEYTSSRHTISLFNDKPYLLPLSSMTEEQILAFWKIEFKDNGGYENDWDFPLYPPKVGNHFIIEALDWLNRNHFDYRGLIEKGLAIDATGKDIY